MPRSTVTWVQKLQFVGTDSGKHSVVLSKGDEENGTGMKPSDLLLISLASCSAVDVVNILQKKRKQLMHLEIEVEAEQRPDPPWAYTHIHLHYIFTGQNISARDAHRAIQLSHERYCSVSATLRGTVELTHDYEIREPAGLAE